MTSKDRIEMFSNIPESELSNISSKEEIPVNASEVHNVINEFQETKQHVKQDTFNGNISSSAPSGAGETKDSIDQPAQQSKKNRLGKLMGGELAVDLVDMLIPSLTVYLVRQLGYDFDKKYLQLSKSEKEALSPAVQDVLDEINIDFSNPYVNLGVMLAIVYGTKVIDKLPEMKKRKKEPEGEKEVSVNEKIQEIVSGGSEEEKEETKDPRLSFEIDYNELVETIAKKRRRGVGEAKGYIAKEYTEQLKKLALKHGLSYSEDIVANAINYVHVKRGEQNLNL